MVSIITAFYIASGALELLLSLLITLKTYRRPKKLRIVLLCFSILTLPASIVNILCQNHMIANHWNSFAYLLSTLFMLVLHFWLNLDIGKHLRVGGINYKCPYVIAGTIALIASILCLFSELVILLVRNDDFPMRPAFITGVIMAIFCDGSTYIYSFSALINQKAERLHEGQSKTTAIGVWFLLIQMIWYSVYGLLYVWFFSINSWEYFTTLLVFDYAARFILCLMFTWSPPNFIIDYMANRYFPGTSQEITSSKSYNNHSAFSMKEDYNPNQISIGHQKQSKQYTQDVQIDDREDLFYSSNVAIVTKSN